MTLVKPLDPAPATAPAPRRSFQRLLTFFDSGAAGSRHLLGKSDYRFDSGGQEYFIPRYLRAGPPGGGDTLRLGLFATLNGDEPEGAFALTRFLESEIWMQAFHGILNLRSDAETKGVYGFASGAVLSQHLLEPALAAAETFLPRNRQRQIEGIPARRGMVYSELYSARHQTLRAVPGLQHPPFEITLATPRTASVHLQVEALHAALKAILAEFRYLQAIAQNL
jgi:hypothetical protein